MPRKKSKSSSSSLPKELTTVTPLSKYLAMAIFVLMPIIAFYLGMHYSQSQASEDRCDMKSEYNMVWDK